MAMLPRSTTMKMAKASAEEDASEDEARLVPWGGQPQYFIPSRLISAVDRPIEI